MCLAVTVAKEWVLNGAVSKKKVFQLSRLWSYTNGLCPDLPEADLPTKKMPIEGNRPVAIRPQKL